MSGLLAWHFMPSDGRLQFGRRSKVRVGQTLRRDPAKLHLCTYGLHASVEPLDALKYAPGPMICRVRIGGTIIKDTDKHVASRRTVLWMADAEKELRMFACWCVRNTPLGDGRTTWDLLTYERIRNAVEVAERCANGLATEEELDAARDAAWYTAGARDAAWYAAWYAARDAAMDAAAVAWYAADAAAEAAGAARYAAWDTQDAELERVFFEMAKRDGYEEE